MLGIIGSLPPAQNESDFKLRGWFKLHTRSSKYSLRTHLQELFEHALTRSAAQSNQSIGGARLFVLAARTAPPPASCSYAASQHP